MNAAAAASCPLRVSTVPPDFEMTTTRVFARFGPISARTLSKPSGSVLSKKWAFIRSRRGVPSAWLTNCGPRAEPPIPMTSRCVRFPLGPVMAPEWIFDANFFIDPRVDWISSRIPLVGARSGARSQ